MIIYKAIVLMQYCTFNFFRFDVAKRTVHSYDSFKETSITWPTGSHLLHAVASFKEWTDFPGMCYYNNS